MKRVFAFLALMLLASSVCLVSAESLKGTISDKMCGADHQGHDAATCVKQCVKGGSAYVFVVGKDKVFDIENQKDAKIAAELDKFAGAAVSATGTMSKDGKSVKLDSVKAAK